MNVRLTERLGAELRRYKGVPASFAYSLANFLLAFALQRHMSLQGFGTFAIVQVYLQFGMSLSNGFFCAPLLLMINSAGKFDPGTIGSLSKANLIACLLGAGGLAMIVSFSVTAPDTLLLVALLAIATWMRWFYRAVELGENNTQAPFLADIYYCIVVTAGTAFIAYNGWFTLNAAFAVLAAGSVAAMATLSRHVILDAVAIVRAPFGPFLASFRNHGRWALLGVVTNEATANSFAYLVTGWLGPAAFAPIAAMNLFYRPITILIQSLTQYERPRMTHCARNADYAQMGREVNRFKFAAVTGAIGNFALAMALLLLAPAAIGNADYPRDQLLLACFLIGGISVLRAARAGDSAALQAMGQFRPLAWITVITAPVSLVLTALAIWLAPQMVAMTLVGVLISEVLVCAMITLHLHNQLAAVARAAVPSAAS
jgi:hypothetical protein